MNNSQLAYLLKEKTPGAAAMALYTLISTDYHNTLIATYMAEAELTAAHSVNESYTNERRRDNSDIGWSNPPFAHVSLERMKDGIKRKRVELENVKYLLDFFVEKFLNGEKPS